MADESVDSLVIPVRLIRSLRHRNIKTIVLKDVPSDITVRDFEERVDKAIQEWPSLPPPFRKGNYDCMKIHHQAHGAKTSEVAISTLDDDKLILNPEKTLKESGVRNETEISYFSRTDYESYKANPEMMW